MQAASEVRDALPSPSGRDRLLPVLLFVVSFAYLASFHHYSSLEPDEGIVLRGAERILRGEVPYRDFFSFYTPGSFYLVALLFRFLGDSLVVARMSLAVAGAACSVITYLLARRVCSRGDGRPQERAQPQVRIRAGDPAARGGRGGVEDDLAEGDGGHGRGPGCPAAGAVRQDSPPPHRRQHGPAYVHCEDAQATGDR